MRLKLRLHPQLLIKNFSAVLSEYHPIETINIKPLKIVFQRLMS
jgi:hypothetical protein